MPKAKRCQVDHQKLEPLERCMLSDEKIKSVQKYASYDPNTDPDGFELCTISKQIVIYDCGTITRGETEAIHVHPSGELPLCRRLANKAAKVMRPAEAGMGSEGTARWSPFFVTAQVGDTMPKSLTPSAVRKAFNGCIASDLTVLVEPLAERGEWWSYVLHDCSDYTETKRYLAPWRNMIEWFKNESAFRSTHFVMIGVIEDDQFAVFPRLAVGITENGSLACIITHVVHT